MTQHKNRKAAIRARMGVTGEPYSEAARNLGEREPLFADKERTDLTARLYTEPAYSFLDRSGDAHVAEIRSLMNTWLGRVPARHDPDLRGRLQSKNDAQFEAAFWELYLYQAYLRSGYRVTIHPPLAGTKRHPDFLVEGKSTRFYLEAVRADAAAEETRKHKLLEEVRQILATVAADRYRLDMNTFEVGEKPPSVKELRNQLRAWLATLDGHPDRDAAAAEHRALARRSWRTRDGWHLEFSAVPLLPERVGVGRLVGMHMSGGFADDAGRITLALEEKANRYGPLDAPLVIAVLSNTESVADDIDFETALYGSWVGRRPSATPPPPDALYQPGHWLDHAGWRRAHCPQVITAQGLFPWTIARVQPRLWSTLQPGTPAPAQPGWLARVDATASPVPRISPADSLNSLFRLPDPWPTVAPNFSSRPSAADL